MQGDTATEDRSTEAAAQEQTQTGEEQHGEPTAEELAQQEKEAEAAFAAGHARVAPHKEGEETPKPEGEETPKPEEDEPDAEAKAKADAEAAAAAKAADEAAAKARAEEEAKQVAQTRQQEQDQMPERLRRLEGRVGEVLQKIEDFGKTQRQPGQETAAPTSEEVNAAMSDPEALKQLAEEYPDFAPLIKEIEAMHTAIANAGGSVEMDQLGQRIDALMANAYALAEEGRQKSVLDFKHEDWETTTKSDGFINFMLEGGPNRAAFDDMNDPEAHNEAEADSIINDWAFQYPQWWAEKGVYLFSSSARDASKGLDLYANHLSSQDDAARKVAEEAELKRKQQSRLEGAVDPATSGAPVEQGLSDQAAFERGHARVIKK